MYKPHWLLAFGGSAYGSEEWQCTLRVAHLGADVSDVDMIERAQAWLPAVATATLAFFANVPYCFTSAHKIGFVKFNAIDENGHYTDTGATNARYYTDGVGTAIPVQPPQCAYVVSFTTDAMRGKAHAGRMYLPAGGMTTGADGRISGAVRDAVRPHVSAFLTGVKDAVAPDPDDLFSDDYRGPAILSKIGVGLEPGAARRITGIRLGRVVDTQRRRRANLDEDYQAGAWPS